MEKWICTRCDYLYNPNEGDARNEIEPGTSFKDLPKEWVCPDCGAEKSKFEIFVEKEMMDETVQEYGGY